ncbi:MAG TPA: AI-2E family transporter [Piscirickettsiaceae bacterium]|nr:AI-2E family transporter [Piscirickettsiaceae bacterium]
MIFYFTRKILIPIILAAILAYVTYPIYKKYWNIFKKEKLAAFLVVLQTTLIFILPLLYVMFQIIYNLINLYKYYLQNDELLVNFKFELFNILYNLIPYEEIRERVIQSFLEVTNDIFSYFSQLFLSFTSSIPVLIVYLIIIVLSQYYFFSF